MQTAAAYLTFPAGARRCFLVRQATVVKLLPNYRVADVENDGTGVLVRYDLRFLSWPSCGSQAAAAPLP
jgi:hypothetical protein